MHKAEIRKKMTSSDEDMFTTSGCLEPLEVPTIISINRTIQICMLPVLKKFIFTKSGFKKNVNYDEASANII